MLLNNAHLEHLDLSGQRLVEPTATLVEALKENSCLKQFILNDCISFTKHCLDFIGAIGSHQSLQTAGLAGLNLNKDCSQLAVYLLSASCKLKELDLSLPASIHGDPSREEHPKYLRLFEFLSKNTTLRSLSIAGRPLNDETQKKFLAVLEESKLQSLDIRGCGFGAKPLAKAVTRSSSLISLRVDGLGESDATGTIRDEIEKRRLAPAAIGMQGLSFSGAMQLVLPADVALEIGRWIDKHGALPAVAVAGGNLPLRPPEKPSRPHEKKRVRNTTRTPRPGGAY